MIMNAVVCGGHQSCLQRYQSTNTTTTTAVISYNTKRLIYDMTTTDKENRGKNENATDTNKNRPATGNRPWCCKIAATGAGAVAATGAAAHVWCLLTSSPSSAGGNLELKTAPTFKPRRINADAASATCQNDTLCRFGFTPAARARSVKKNADVQNRAPGSDHRSSQKSEWGMCFFFREKQHATRHCCSSRPHTAICTYSAPLYSRLTCATHCYVGSKS